MRILLRWLGDCADLWHWWLPLTVLAAIVPPIVYAQPLLQKELVDAVVVPKRLDLLPWVVGSYAVLWLLHTGTFVVASIIRTYVDELLQVRLRRRLLEHCERLSIAFSRQEHSGQTMALFVNDVPVLAGLFTHVILGG